MKIELVMLQLMTQNVSFNDRSPSRMKLVAGNKIFIAVFSRTSVTKCYLNTHYIMTISEGDICIY